MPHLEALESKKRQASIGEKIAEANDIRLDLQSFVEGGDGRVVWPLADYCSDRPGRGHNRGDVCFAVRPKSKEGFRSPLWRSWARLK